VLGFLAGLAAALCLVMLLRARDEPGRIYWLGYAILPAGVFMGWVLFR
jgi:hypothetical protein